jgi:hypothetical protein
VRLLCCAAALLLLPLLSAQAQDVPPDTVAERLMDAHGAAAFQQAPYLRFTFAVERDGNAGAPIRHLWNRRTGDYRVEWTQNDSLLVALINVNDVSGGTPAGTVYHEGAAVEGARGARLRAHAYRRYINDTYWLLAPLKVMDPGVNRSYVADSSDAAHHVLHLTFGDVGLTPGDEYWLYVDRDTGRLDRWAFHLESMPDEAPPSVFNWTAYEALETPGGTVHLATRHAAAGGPVAILTDDIALPASPPDGAFSDPLPMLASE